MSNWNDYNGEFPITPCGYGNSLGNNTGIVTIPSLAYTNAAGTSFTRPSMTISRYRGFENPFGDIFLNLDGIVIKRYKAGDSSTVYTTTDPLLFDDSVSNKNVAGYETSSDGSITQFDLGSNAEIIPLAVGGGGTTYMCDYHWNTTSLDGRALLVGSCAYDSSGAGLGYFNSNDGVGDGDSTRLDVANEDPEVLEWLS